ncbi:hypothetical protein BGX34_004531, partial [Mortierella sp. NVP85]
MANPITSVAAEGRTFIDGGFYGKVYKSTHSGGPIAIKIVTDDLAKRDQAQAELENESRVLKTLASLHIPNTVVYKGECRDENNKIKELYMEWIEPKVGDLTDTQKKEIVKQFLDTLGVLHKNHIFHADLTKHGKNVIITNQNTIKLIDFGSAKIGERFDGISAQDVSGLALLIKKMFPSGQPTGKFNDLCQEIEKCNITT